ncbi:MAG: D-2-hydroxyacid dehydrogenase family protein [Chloroflexota bacterium]
MKTYPNLLILDDTENVLANAPALKELQSLANITIFNHSIQPEDDLSAFNILFALRERTQINSELLDRFPKLELILQSGGHAYHLDQDAATSRGIVIALGRGAKNPMVVMPELTWALILGLNRQLYLVHQQMAQGEWPEVIGTTLHGKTLGILGYGRHGKPIAKIGRIFGMKIAAWDRGGHYASDEADVARYPLEELMRISDIVTVHLKLSDESKGLISRELLEKMKSTALFINTSRGAIVDEDALADILAAGKIAGAGLDVFTKEPLAENSRLRSLPNVILTPHIGWKVDILLHEWMEMAANQLEEWLNQRLNPEVVLNPAAVLVPKNRLGNIAS